MARDVCVVLRKRGFREEFLNAAIDLRREYSDLPGPRLLDWNAGEGWYVEERIAGLPLNRVADSDRADRALTAARQALASLYGRNAKDIDICDWLDDRLRSVVRALDGLPSIYGPGIRDRVRAEAEMLGNVLLQRMGSGGSIPVAMTHGDFQPANILVPYCDGKGPVYLIDWEYSAVRCRWYDALVFELNSRFPAGLARRVADWIGDKSRIERTMAWCSPDTAPRNGVVLAASFLLEDLLLRLKDTSIPGLRETSSGFLGFLDEIALLRLDAS
jgi:hypothetical protein